MLAARDKSIGKVNYLLGHISDIDANEICTDDGCTALDHCIESFDEAVFERLIEYVDFTPTTWDLIFENDCPYFTPAKFLSVINKASWSQTDMFCDYFLECQNRDIDITPYLTARDAKQRHALLIAAMQNKDRIYSSLLRFDFELGATDIHGCTVFYYWLYHRRQDLIKRTTEKLKRFNSAITLDFYNHMDWFNFGDSRQVGQLLTKGLSTNQEGRVPLAHPGKAKRPYRSFSTQRTRQLLRHISTQLFFFARTRQAKVEEIECMYLFYRGQDYLFVVGNPILEFSRIKDDLRAPGNFQTIITRLYSPHYVEEKRRSARYARKLNHRVYGARNIPAGVNADANDQARAQAIKRLLLARQITSVDISHSLAVRLNAALVGLPTGGIILLNANSVTLRHAEEFLVDILDSLPENDPTMFSVIAGKKRPCMGCFGRMQGKVDECGQHPGRFWLHTMESQSTTAAKRTTRALLQHPAHVSVTRDGSQDISMFDSGSDSDG
ncbi:MAG: hypothetical protein K5Q00_05700 [Gammaproteobacteria bacterium]|nr:hypothetical protein [Gammaproteobacteria bacterium]